MNALRIILTLIIILYLIMYHSNYWKYFFYAVIPYYLITQLLFLDKSKNSPKKKSFISMWSHPSDPQIYGSMKFNLSKVEEYLKAYSSNKGTNVGFTIFLMKVMAKMLEMFPQVNGNVIFGKFVEKKDIDISLMVALEGGSESDLITVKNCNNLSLEEIAKKLKEKKEAFENKSDKGHSRRLFVAKLLPTFLLSPFVRIMSFLSTCGLNLSWLWLPKYAYGTCVIANLGKLGIQSGYLPIPPYTYSPLIVSLGRKVKKSKIDAGVMTESTFVELNFTIDHRYMDGALIAKISAEVK